MSLHKSQIFPFSNPFLVEPAIGIADPNFLNAIQQIIDSLIPDSLWLDKLDELTSLLPLFTHSEWDDSSQSLCISYLYPAVYTHQARRYVIDTLTKWLNPGKPVEIAGGISLNIQFAKNPSQKFFVSREIISIRNREENHAIKKNLPDLLIQLKNKLPCEFFRQAENQVHPIFMPRNEEEMIRNLIVLAAQIKYVRDLPQVSIHFEEQTDVDLTFTVIIARLLKGEIEPLRKLLEKSSLKMHIDDVRVMGYLKQKYPKEAAVLRVTVDKRPFFRPDFSLDLLRARQKIGSELGQCLGEFRDFNGGMILKQDEALTQLRDELGKLSEQKEFLLENYFYSLRPAIMQTVHDSAILKRHFEQLNSVLTLNPQPVHIAEETIGKFFLAFIAAASPSFKESILNAIAPLEISSRDLTTCFLERDGTYAMGLILRIDSSDLSTQFQRAVSDALNEWSQRFYCPLVDSE